MKKVIATLAFLLVSLFTFAQKDTVIVAKKVLMLPDSSFFVQTTTTNVSHQRINAMSLQQVDLLEQSKEQQLAESVKRNAERKELVRLYKEAINKGYKLDPRNSIEQQMGDRVYKKIVAEKLN